MSEAITVALIVSIAPTLTALCLGWKTRKETIKVQQAVQEVHLLLNSRLDELVSVSRKESRAAGRVEGIESERNRK